MPVAAYGVSQAVLDRIEADDEGDYLDWGGVGGTLAGNALSLAATRATLAEVLTDEAFVRMTELATRYREGVQAAIDRHGVPWCVVQLGARAEYHFYPEPPVSGGQAAALIDDELDDYLHLYTLNRGIVMTPFHNMALMCPATYGGRRRPAQRGLRRRARRAGRLTRARLPARGSRLAELSTMLRACGTLSHARSLLALALVAAVGVVPAQAELQLGIQDDALLTSQEPNAWPFARGLAPEGRALQRRLGAGRADAARLRPTTRPTPPTTSSTRTRWPGRRPRSARRACSRSSTRRAGPTPARRRATRR